MLTALVRVVRIQGVVWVTEKTEEMVQIRNPIMRGLDEAKVNRTAAAKTILAVVERRRQGSDEADGSVGSESRLQEETSGQFEELKMEAPIKATKTAF